MLGEHFDRFLAVDLARTSSLDARARWAEMVEALAPQCGNCSNWMIKRRCAREADHIVGSGERPCKDYAEKASVNAERTANDAAYKDKLASIAQRLGRRP